MNYFMNNQIKFAIQTTFIKLPYMDSNGRVVVVGKI